MNQEVIKKINECKTEEEIIEFCKTLEMLPLFRLDYAHKTVLQILDVAQLVEKHKEDLLREENKEIVKAGKFGPSSFLGEYILLEISSFYTLCYLYKTKKKYDLPDIPKYWDKLKEFRNDITGHRDNDEKFNTLTEWMEAYKKIDRIGMDKILNDFLEYVAQIEPLIKSKKIPLVD